MTEILKKYRDVIAYTFIMLFLIIFAAISISYAGKQHIFLVRNIEIIGNNEVSELEILGRGNIQRGMSIFNTDFITNAHLMREHPYIWNARINTILPDKIQIEISERQAEVLLKAGNIYALDKFATLLPPPANYEHLPLITGISSTAQLRINNKVIDPVIRDGLQMVNLMNRHYPNVRKRTTELHWDDNEQNWIIIFNASRKPLIHIGNTLLHKRLEIFEKYLDSEVKAGRNISRLDYIDLRFKDQIIEK